MKGRLATLPAGSIVLQKLGDETIRVINPGNKTWYEIPASQNLGALLGTPDVTIEPAGEKATIAGQRADRFRFTRNAARAGARRRQPAAGFSEPTSS